MTVKEETVCGEWERDTDVLEEEYGFNFWKLLLEVLIWTVIIGMICMVCYRNKDKITRFKTIEITRRYRDVTDKQCNGRILGFEWRTLTLF